MVCVILDFDLGFSGFIVSVLCSSVIGLVIRFSSFCILVFTCLFSSWMKSEHVLILFSTFL